MAAAEAAPDDDRPSVGSGERAPSISSAPDAAAAAAEELRAALVAGRPRPTLKRAGSADGGGGGAGHHHSHPPHQGQHRIHIQFDFATSDSAVHPKFEVGSPIHSDLIHLSYYSVRVSPEFVCLDQLLLSWMVLGQTALSHLHHGRQLYLIFKLLSSFPFPTNALHCHRHFIPLKSRSPKHISVPRGD